MKKIIAALSVVALVLVAPAAQAASSDYTKKQKNRFWKVVTMYDPLVKYAGKKTTVNLGVATCDFLRSGADLYDLSLLVLESDMGFAEDSAMAIMAAAPVILCPDQQYKFD